MISFYQIFLNLIRISKFLLRLIPHKKLQYFFQNEGKIQISKPFQSRPIWIHASSGEIEYAKSLIRGLKKQYPQIPLLVTHTSISSRKSLKNLDVSAWGVAPLDSPQEIRAFLSQWNPRACLIARTDIWPQTIKELNHMHIPCFLFSATFAEGSKKINFFARQILKSCLPLINKIYFVSPMDEITCKKFYPAIKGKVIGDTRYDQVANRLSEKIDLKISDHNKIFIAGSTWPEDENVLLPSLEKLKEKNWKFILVPHEVGHRHIQKLERRLQHHNLHFFRFSDGVEKLDWSKNDVLLVDQIGFLASLYPMARVAFVGGSFRKQVHSVMEALATSTPVVVGPYFKNNREAIEFENLGFVRSAVTQDELVQSIEFFEEHNDTIRRQLKVEFDKHLGGTDRLLSELKFEGIFAEGKK